MEHPMSGKQGISATFQGLPPKHHPDAWIFHEVANCPSVNPEYVKQISLIQEANWLRTKTCIVFINGESNKKKEEYIRAGAELVLSIDNLDKAACDQLGKIFQDKQSGRRKRK
jgi:hypothetical protein